MSWLLLNTYFDVENALSYKWHILGEASNPLGYSWHVLNGAENPLGYSWNIWGFIDNSLGLGWYILNGIAVPLDYGWSVSNFYATNRPQYTFNGPRRVKGFSNSGVVAANDVRRRFR